MKAVKNIDRFLDTCDRMTSQKMLSEQLSKKDFELIGGFVNQKDELGVDAAISTVRDKVKDEMELIMNIANTNDLKNVRMAFKKFYVPFDKAMTALEEDPLDNSKYMKASKAFENLIKGFKKLV